MTDFAQPPALTGTFRDSDDTASQPHPVQSGRRARTGVAGPRQWRQRASDACSYADGQSGLASQRHLAAATRRHTRFSYVCPHRARSPFPLCPEIRRHHSLAQHRDRGAAGYAWSPGRHQPTLNGYGRHPSALLEISGPSPVNIPSPVRASTFPGEHSRSRSTWRAASGSLTGDYHPGQRCQLPRQLEYGNSVRRPASGAIRMPSRFSARAASPRNHPAPHRQRNHRADRDAGDANSAHSGFPASVTVPLDVRPPYPLTR